MRPYGTRNMAEWERTNPLSPDRYWKVTDRFWVGIKRGEVWIAVSNPSLFPKESDADTE